MLLVDLIFWQMIDNTDCERQTLIPNFAPGTSNLNYEVGGLSWSPRVKCSFDLIRKAHTKERHLCLLDIAVMVDNPRGVIATRVGRKLCD